jgi:hypothetical protein
MAAQASIPFAVARHVYRYPVCGLPPHTEPAASNAVVLPIEGQASEVKSAVVGFHELKQRRGKGTRDGENQAGISSAQPAYISLPVVEGPGLVILMLDRDPRGKADVLYGVHWTKAFVWQDKKAFVPTY